MKTTIAVHETEKVRTKDFIVNCSESCILTMQKEPNGIDKSL